ncbi:MAG: hypothetical protein OXC26_16355, partial [Albidovulum sp.]|nr:hypothetical protein [Albidovulum sp.]
MLLRIVRERWHIENRLHYVRDWTFDEDRCRAHVRRTPRNLACPGNAAISIVRFEGRFPYMPPANRYYAARAQDAIARLSRAGTGGGPKPTAVMDAGISTEENLTWLGGEGCRWITVARGRKPKPPKGEPDIRLETSAGDEVRAWRVEAGESEKMLFVCSDGRKQKEDAILARQRQRFEEGLSKLHLGLSVKGRMKRRDKVLESVGRLREKYPKAARHYSIEVDGDEKGRNAVAVRFRCNHLHAEADEFSGSCLMRTTRKDWDCEAILRTYWKLSEIEAAFRSLKSELGLRPVYHRLDKRIRSHLLIAALAYHPAHLIRTRLKSEGINLSWASV